MGLATRLKFAQYRSRFLWRIQEGTIHDRDHQKSKIMFSMLFQDSNSPQLPLRNGLFGERSAIGMAWKTLELFRPCGFAKCQMLGGNPNLDREIFWSRSDLSQITLDLRVPKDPKIQVEAAA